MRGSIFPDRFVQERTDPITPLPLSQQSSIYCSVVVVVVVVEEGVEQNWNFVYA